LNTLAHLVLAGPDQDLRLGAFLGDFLPGPLPGPHPPGLARGLALHRYIDRLTDSDPGFRALKALAPAHLRRYMPIALDVIFDHCLARRFEALTGHILEAFSTEALGDLKALRHAMPAPAQQLLAALDTHAVLPAYAHWPAVERTLRGIARRRPRLLALGDLAPALEPHRDTIAAIFEDRFPALEAACAAWLADPSRFPGGDATLNP
jgi:acyl carrier protein phosphodiesterase